MTTLPDIEQAVWALKDGDTLVLPAGAYPAGGVRKAVFPNGVTITAEPGTTIGGLVLQDCAGITLKGLDILVNPAQGGALICQGGERISAEVCKIHGTGVGDALGVKFQNCPNSVLTGSEVFNVGVGVAVVNSDNVRVTDNLIHLLQVDGVQSTGSSNETITGNRFREFFPANGDHSDCIQFEGVGQTKPVTDILIAGNSYIRGPGEGPITAKTPGVQGVFMNDESGLGYARVTIEDNAFLGVIYNGIAVSHIDDLTIGNNLVTSYTDTLQIDYRGDGELIDIVSWILGDAKCTSGTVSGNQASNFNIPDGSALTWAINTTIPIPAPADAPALLAAWDAAHAPASPPPPPPVAPPPPPAPAPSPPPGPDPAAEPDMATLIATLEDDMKAVTTQLAAANARAAKAEADLKAALAQAADLAGQLATAQQAISADAASQAAAQAALEAANAHLAALQGAVARFEADPAVQ